MSSRNTARTLVVLVLVAAHAATADARRGQLLSPHQLAVGHPGRQSALYHNLQHTSEVVRLTHDSARARGRSAKEALFLSQVAQVHDWDGTRPVGTKPRVPFTIAALRADFAGEAPLVPGARGSVLKQKFGWGQRELDMALAIIQRSEFTFADSHEGVGYDARPSAEERARLEVASGEQLSPLARYELRLASLEPTDRAFVLEEAALLSEYADKSSLYLSRDFPGVLKAFTSLIAEEKATRNFDLPRDTSDKFLATLGSRKSFDLDYQLAARFGVEGFALPERAEFLAAMPRVYGQRYRANLAGFVELGEALREHETFEAASRIGTRAYRHELRAAEDEPRAGEAMFRIEPGAEAARDRFGGERGGRGGERFGREVERLDRATERGREAREARDLREPRARERGGEP